MPFTYSRALRIDHTLCGLADSPNFPVLVSGSSMTLADVAHGGHVTSSTGGDLLFFSDAALTTQIASELEFYDNVNGTVVAWVKVANVSHTADVTIYVAYGNAAPPARTTNPWDANFIAGYHLGNGSVLSVLDFTGNNNGTNAGATAAAGKIDGAANFVAVSNQHVVGPTINMTAYAGVTLSAWINPTTFQAVFPNISTVLGEDGGGAGTAQIRFGDAALSKDTPQFVLGVSAGAFSLNGSIPFTTGSWQHVAATWDGTTMKLYRNGVLDTSVVHAGVLSANNPFWIGQSSGNVRPWDGLIDEPRLSNVDRGAAWLLTEFNNQNSPGNINSPGFITWGTEVGSSGGILLMGCGA